MIIIPTILDKITTLKDGSFKISLETPELPSETVVKLYDMRNKQIVTAFAETTIKPEDLDIKEVEEELNEFPKQKSLSERLRDVLWVYWDQKKPARFPEFESFRRWWMEQKINKIKEQLE